MEEPGRHKIKVQLGRVHSILEQARRHKKVQLEGYSYRMTDRQTDDGQKRMGGKERHERCGTTNMKNKHLEKEESGHQGGRIGQ